MKNKYLLTYIACFCGIFCQALVINYIPLLFVSFENNLDISLEKISFLITLSFVIQLFTDYLAGGLINRLGYRACACISQLLSGLGLLCLGILPGVLNPYVGIVISVCIYSLGAGLIEVVVSPVVEGCPGKRKEAAMSLLHSFYCWGYVIVVLISTAVFSVCGMESMYAMSLIWSIIPFANMLLFMKASIPYDMLETKKAEGIRTLFRNKLFLVFLLIMMCGGAAEMGISQWASALAEKSFGVSKAVGDIMGPCIFAVCMGSARLLTGLYKGKLPLKNLMLAGGIFAGIGYVLASLPFGVVTGFIGCAMIGVSVAVMWPGTLSLAAKAIPGGGAYMYSFLALAGDAGCALGPATVGYISNLTGGNLATGLLAGSLFPIVLSLCIIAMKHLRKS